MALYTLWNKGHSMEGQTIATIATIVKAKGQQEKVYDPLSSHYLFTPATLPSYSANMRVRKM